MDVSIQTYAQNRIWGRIGRLLSGLLLAVVILTAFVVMGTIATSGLHFVGNTGSYLSAAGALLLVLLALVTVGSQLVALSFLVDRMAYRAEQHTSLSGAEILKYDPRAPILYLRSFDADSTLSNFEVILACAMGEVGPVVAIGRPKEQLPHVGAARFLVADEDWQAFVLELMSKAALVVMVPGRTVGLGWELKQCRDRIHPERLLLVYPSDNLAINAFAEQAHTVAALELPDWQTLVGKEGIDKNSLVERPFLGLVTFESNWLVTARMIEPARRLISLELLGLSTLNLALRPERSLRKALRGSSFENAQRISRLAKPKLRTVATALIFSFGNGHFWNTLLMWGVGLLVIFATLLR